ncbi:MAG: hypothetical protein B6A08_14935 [Sorangiineae bacterium NIC37A_2]|nr:MAG: hypothetical protein B6A08_14935 [Sorangiineae bacterium NIC37A_2]
MFARTQKVRSLSAWFGLFSLVLSGCGEGVVWTGEDEFSPVDYEAAPSTGEEEDSGEPTGGGVLLAEDVRETDQAVVDGWHNTTPTQWAFRTGQTSAQVNALINSGFRLVSLQVQSASPLLFTVAAVQNTGSHAQTSSWIHGATAYQLEVTTASQNLRIVDVHAYQTAAGTRFAAIMVPNTGANAKNWWWAHGKTPEELGEIASANGARPIDLQSYIEDGVKKYTAVFIENSGADGKAWWWYFDRTSPQVDAIVNFTGGCLTSINPTPEENFDVLLLPCEGTFWEWWNGFNEAEVNARAEAMGTRVFDVKYLGPNRFVSLHIENSDAEAIRLRSRLRGSSPRGELGFMVKRVGGPIERSMNVDYAYDPASSIKTLIAVHALRGMEHAAFTLNTPINMYDPGNVDCPQNATLLSTQESMGDAIWHMQVLSDNYRTRAFMDLFSKPVLEQFGRDLGMQKIHIVDYPGCPTFANRWSLRDALRLYEGIMDGSIFVQSSSRDALFSRMPADGGSASALDALKNIVIEEGTALGRTSSQINAFNNMLRAHYKVGHHYYPHVYIPPLIDLGDISNASISGIARIPSCNGSAMVYRDYVWGAFVHNATHIEGRDALFGSQAEPLRLSIRDALTTAASCL